ncbi:MAG TPA: hypothetical protein VK363_19425 [Pyrinomonadaceae bacterium]|nr:hypothetical protein [Pyrinomonadaceae bacterium]
MENVLAKRLIFLTKIYIVALALAVVSLLHNYDSKDLGRDLFAINLIVDTTTKVNVPLLYAEGEIQKGAREWLNKRDAALWESNRKVREVITNHLIKEGTSIDDLEKAKGAGRYTSGKITFSLIDIPVPGNAASEQNEQSEGDDDESEGVEVKTINDLINKFTSLSKPVEVVVATSIAREELNKIELKKEPRLEKKDEQDSPQAFLNQIMGGGADEAEVGGTIGGVKFGLTSVLLKGDTIEVLFTEVISGVSQKLPAEKKYQLRATTQKISGDSLLALIGRNSQFQEQLYNNASQIKRLSSLYGSFSPEISKNIVTEDLLRAYKGIELLGFTFSTRRFPFGILLFNLLAALGIFWTIRTARHKSIKVLSEVNDEDITDVLIDSPLMRIALWVIVPALTVWLALPVVPLGSVESASIYTGMSILILLGLASLFQSKKL